MLQLGQESPPAGEPEVLLQISRIVEAHYKNSLPKPPDIARRDAHLKSHGCVQAEFIVDDQLDEELRHGIFSAPLTYQAWIRFSSGALQIQSDNNRSVQGMAIKLLGVDGKKILEDEQDETTQDFLLANYHIFFVRSALDYLEFQSQLAAGTIYRFFFGWNPFHLRVRELLIVFFASFTKIASPLEVRYWSQTPYKLGNTAIKFSARPASLKKAKAPWFSAEHYLEDAMAARLKEDDFWFDFLVQTQVDGMKMPIEDPTIAWDESLSPFRRVARIRIPKQEFTFAARKTFDENLSFTPWHALPDHRPLGGINRVRREVYTLISILRHRYNNAPRHEP